MDYRTIDFDRELNRGLQTYNQKLGKWWRSRSQDAPHQYAYRKIAHHVRSLFRRPPRRIIDYGCGGGHLLSRLFRRFPSARLTGIDGSPMLLEMTQRRLQRLDRNWRERVSLLKTELPDFSLPEGGADLLVYIFPNIVPDPDEDDAFKRYRFIRGRTRAVARYLARAREPDPEEETVTDDPDTLYDSLMTDRVIAHNLRRLLKRGGVCVRVEYANAPREELTPLVQQRLAFEDGSLDEPVQGRRCPPLFRLVDSVYARSRVIEDVYHQTRDEEDLEGGYHLTTLVAI